MKGKGGRPTKYKPEFCNKLLDYFTTDLFRKEVIKTATEYFKDGGIKKKSEEYKLVANEMPTLHGFSEKIGVSYETIRRWADEDGKNYIDEFCVAYKEAKEKQKRFLISLGLSGISPAAAFIFVAKNVTDMRDKTEVSQTITMADILNKIENDD